MLRLRAISALFLVAFAFLRFAEAQIVPFGLYGEAEFSPDFELLESSSDLIRFGLDMARLQPTGQIDLTQELPGTWGEMNSTGSLMPRFTFYLALPPTGNPSVTVESWTTVTRPATPRNIPENNSNVPRVSLGPVGIFGGVRLVPVTVKPVTYTNNSNSCQILDEATIRIDIDDSQGVNPLASVRSHYSEAWRAVLEAVVMNSDDIPNLYSSEPSHVLIIAPDTYFSALEEYVKWKQQLGMTVTLIPASQIDDDNSGNQLRARLISDLAQLSPRIDYVVLVGDETVLPTNILYTQDPVSRFSDVSFPGNFTNEAHFTELEGNDPFPDIFLGRWPVNSQSEVRSIVNRTVMHERNTFQSDSSRFERCVVSADHSVDTQRLTIAYSREMLLNAGFQEVDTVYSLYTPNPQQMLNAVDEGVTFVNHRGSGWNQGWAGINFYNGTVPQISNAGKLCVVTGIGCGVAKFDAGDNECFGERWMLHGSVTNPQGAVGFIGPCWNTHTVYNDVLDTCLYKAILDYNIDELSPALAAGKMFSWAMFADFVDEDGVNQVATMMMRQYLTLSDPSLMLFTDTPDRLPVTLPTAIPAGPFALPITLSAGFTTEADSLTVGFRTQSQNTEMHVIPAEPGTWIVPVDFAFGDTIVATISGHNVLTQQHHITVAPTGAYLIHQSFSISDAEGNGDGRIQPGELIALTDTVRNVGSEPATGVIGFLGTGEENVEFGVNESGYGSVDAQEAGHSEPPFTFTVLSGFRGTSLAFEVVYDAIETDPRSEPFFVTVYSPELAASGLTINDGNDGILNRNEEGGFVFTITNTGNEILSSASIQISTNNSYLNVLDGTFDLPDLNPNQQYVLPPNALRVAAAWNTPSGTQALVDVEITADLVSYTFERSFSLPLVLGQVGQNDPMAGSDGMYYMYDDTDVDYDHAAVYDWIEISPEEGGPGIELPFVQSHQTFAVVVPFAYSYFGVPYNSLSISTDGFVVPGVTEATNYDNHALPYETDFVSGMIAVMWNDLWWYFGDFGDVSYHYDSVSDRFIVEWHEVSTWGNSNRPSTFQLQLLNPATYPTPTGDAEWLMLYQDLYPHETAAEGATVGYETMDELNGATYYFNGSAPVTSAPFENGRAIRLTTAPPVILDAPPSPTLPSSSALYQNYPNPFNPETSIEYSLVSPANIRLEVFDILGRNVATLATGVRQAGRHVVHWNGKSNAGISVPSGIYFYRLTAPEFVQTRRMLLMR